MSSADIRQTIIVGIEEGRGRLGDLVNAAITGDDVIITRNGRPAARLVPFHPESVHDSALHCLTSRTQAAIDELVDHLVAQELASDKNRNLLSQHHRLLRNARHAVENDIRDIWMADQGNDRNLPGYAVTLVRILVRNAFAVRLCQCHLLNPVGVCSHANPAGPYARCGYHYESDVPRIGDTKAALCGNCYVATTSTNR